MHLGLCSRTMPQAAAQLHLETPALLYVMKGAAWIPATRAQPALLCAAAAPAVAVEDWGWLPDGAAELHAGGTPALPNWRHVEPPSCQHALM